MKNMPQQKLPLSKKTESWKRQTIDAYIDLSNFEVGHNSYRDWLLSLYGYYNGEINDSDYSYVLKPYGETRKNFPAKIRNYPIIKPIVDLLLGEKSKRPLNFQVVVANGDVETRKEQELKEMLVKNMHQHIINMLNEEGIDTGMESQEAPLPDEVAADFERSWKDFRAIMGEKALNYIIPFVNFYNKTQKSWFHFLVGGMAFSHRGVCHNEVFYEIPNPLDVDYDKDPDLEFVEDGDWALIRKLAHPSTVLDTYHDDLTDEEVLRLENPHGDRSDAFFHYNDDRTSMFDHRDRLIEVYIVYWKTFKRVGIYGYYDEFGEWQEEEVEEGFSISKEQRDMGETLEWMWISEVWEGHRIDGDIYKRVGPIPVQRRSLDNPSICKLPINGRKYSDINSSNISLVSLGIAFQLSYNIYKYRLENAIAKSKDILAMIDINLIPEGWTMEKFLYYVEATGIAWTKYNNETNQFNPQHQNVLDLSIKTIEQYLSLLRFIKEEWEQVSGISRQRQGQTSQYELKGTTEQSIIQSSHITEDYFRKHAELEQRDLAALLDYSKYAWINGKKGMYVMPDHTTDMLSIDGIEHMESEYGVFVSDAQEDVQKLNYLRELGQAMVQNDTPLSVIADILDSNSFAGIKDKIKQAERHREQLEQQMQQMEQEMAQAAQEFEVMKLDREDMNQELDRQNKLELEAIKSGDKEAQARINERKSEIEAQKANFDMSKEQKELELKHKQLEEVKRSNKAKEDIERVKAKKQTSKP